MLELRLVIGLELGLRLVLGLGLVVWRMFSIGLVLFLCLDMRLSTKNIFRDNSKVIIKCRMRVFITINFRVKFEVAYRFSGWVSGRG